jgi:hypothetical protein
MVYFDDYSSDLDGLRASEVKCNLNWPMIFLFRNASSGSVDMIQPKSLSSYVSQEEYWSTIDALFLNGTVDEMRKRVGTLQSPLQMTSMTPLGCDADNTLTYDDVVSNTASMCTAMNALNGSSLAVVCDLTVTDLDGLGVYTSDVPQLNRNTFHPVFRPDQTVKDVCVTTCATVSKVSQRCVPPSPLPPPPSPPPPLSPEVLRSCANEYMFGYGWNSFALVGDDVTYSDTGANRLSFTGNNFAQFDTTSDYILNASFFSDAFLMDVNVNNAFRVFAMEAINMTTTCDANVEVQCSQIVQLDAGVSSFGIRSSTGVNLDDLTFSPYSPLEGDVIQNDHLVDYQLLVYWNMSWRNVSGARSLNPYTGYFYHTTRANSFLMTVC